jgi:hypothetical protein
VCDRVCVMEIVCVCVIERERETEREIECVCLCKRAVDIKSIGIQVLLLFGLN